MTDDELNRRFDVLMERINANHEALLERFGSVERLLGLLGPLVVDHARRLTDLEKK